MLDRRTPEQAHPLVTAPDEDLPAIARTSSAGPWLAVAAVVVAVLCLSGATTPGDVTGNLHLEPIIILLALDRFADLLVQTNALSALAHRAVRASLGRRSRVSVVLVGFLMVTGTVNNNITTCLLVLPAVVLMLRTVEAETRPARTVGALVLGAGNVAGASTPTGDFPAHFLVGAGAITYADYLRVGTPLFVLTALVLALLYRWLLRSDDTAVAADRLRALEAVAPDEPVDRRAVARLLAVFAAMVPCWILLDGERVPPAAVAVAGLAVAAVVIRGTQTRLRLREADLVVAGKLTAILVVSAAVAGTGVVTDIASSLMERVDSPLLLLLLLMVLTTVAAGLIDASGAAAGLLPLLLALTAEGAPLGSCSALAVIGYAAAICAGSSLWTTSATAGQLLEHRLNGARLVDPDTGRPIRFTWGSYAPFGAMNCVVQLAIATAYVSVFALVTGVA